MNSLLLLDPILATLILCGYMLSDMEPQTGSVAQNRKRPHEDPGSDESDENPRYSQSHHGLPRQRGNTVKSCNECRQQKLRCDVLAEPGQTNAPCSRCRKHNLHCKIDNNFKRVKKRGLVIPLSESRTIGAYMSCPQEI